MSNTAPNTPRSFEPSITQRDIKTEVAKCVGGVVSPLLANVYLHYVFDLWADWWRRHRATGEVIIVRFADDYIVGFQYEDDARRFLDELRERLAKFGLELHPDKTRLIEFGRRAAIDRRQRGLGKPQTFDFLGFRISARGCRPGGSGSGALRSRNVCGRNWQKSKTNCGVAGMIPSRFRDGG